MGEGGTVISVVDGSGVSVDTYIGLWKIPVTAEMEMVTIVISRRFQGTLTGSMNNTSEMLVLCPNELPPKAKAGGQRLMLEWDWLQGGDKILGLVALRNKDFQNCGVWRVSAW